MKSESVQCCICKKEIGKLIPEGGMNAGGFIGYIPSYSQKLDYRKASHIYLTSTKGSGNICKTCAKKIFPEGKAYMVAHRMVAGKKMFLYAGKQGYGDYFTTKAEASAVMDRRNAEYGRNSHWLEEKAI